MKYIKKFEKGDVDLRNDFILSNEKRRFYKIYTGFSVGKIKYILLNKLNLYPYSVNNINYEKLSEFNFFFVLLLYNRVTGIRKFETNSSYRSIPKYPNIGDKYSIGGETYKYCGEVYMTPEEIENYELSKLTSKYNI